MSDLPDKSSLSARLQRASTAIYLACDEHVAKDVSELLREAADVIELHEEATKYNLRKHDDLKAKLAKARETLGWYAGASFKSTPEWQGQPQALCCKDMGSRARQALEVDEDGKDATP